MAYGTHYTIPFKNSKTGVDCRFDILEKDYIGDVTTLKGGTRSPVVHSWDASSILDPIWGSKCVVQYVNERSISYTGGGLSVVESFPQPWLYQVVFSGLNVNGTININVQTTGFIDSFAVPTTAGESIPTMIANAIAIINVVGNWVASTSMIATDTLFIRDAADHDFVNASTTVPSGNLPVISDATPITDFLTIDETKYRGDLYVNNVLQFTGFMVIDDFQAPYLTPPTFPTLTFTDGLALLNNTTLLDAGYNVRSGRKTISEIIAAILALTNLTLNVRSYYNLFPYNSGYYVDRITSPAVDVLSLQSINTNSFLVSDDGFDDCRTVLEKILKANDSVLMQQQGTWTVVRMPEYKRFNGNIPGGQVLLIPGTGSVTWSSSFLGMGGTFTFSDPLLASYFTIGQQFELRNSTSLDGFLDGIYTVTNITVGANLNIEVSEQPGPPLISTVITGDFYSYQVAPALGTLTVSKTGDLIPIERSQIKQFAAPKKKITNTFNYRIPQLLTNSNLTRLGSFIGTSTDGDNTLKDYQLSDWENKNSEAAYIRVVTNTLTGKEVDRYLFMPFESDSPTAPSTPFVVSVPIEVNQGDRFSLTFRYRGRTNDGDSDFFGIGVHLTSFDGTQNRNLIRLNNSDPATNKLVWSASGGTLDNFSQTLPAKARQGSADSTEWAQFDLINDYDYNEFGMPRFPFDGFLKIGLYGFNNTSGNQANLDCLLKDFQFNYFLFVSDSIQIEGQENKASQPITAKNETAAQIYVDSSPKFNIAGGVFCWDGTRLVLADDFRKESGDTINYQHGEINVIDELLLQSNWRTLFEGEFYGLCNPTDSATIDGLDGMFVPYKLSLDYHQNRCSASFQEVSKSTDPTFDDVVYAFRYLYKIEQK